MERRTHSDVIALLRWASDGIATARDKEVLYEDLGNSYERIKQIGKREAFAELHKLLHTILAETDGDPLHDYMMEEKEK